MITYEVVFTCEAQEQLLDLYRFIAEAASPETAENYVSAIISHCEGLRNFPHRGTRRDDIRPGLCTTHYKKRTVIAFSIDGSTVGIVGVFYAGQDYQAVLVPSDD